MFHKSHETVINELQQNYWILGLRKAIRTLVDKCSICKMMRALPPNPKMSSLPSSRLTYRFRPFTHCGVDYFGLFWVKIGRRREKRWGVLFTCMTTRAIHIEVAHSLSTDSAILSIQKFSARRGFPRIIYSDNGTNFRGADKEIRDTIKNKFLWKFNPPTASHMGGAWESLIKSVKNASYATLKEHAPKEETFTTVLAQVEHSVNSRPLTHVSLDPRDKEALTPNHFLIGTSSGNIRLGHYDAQILCTRKQWQLAQHFADAFWRRWLREYLP